MTPHLSWRQQQPVAHFCCCGACPSLLGPDHAKSRAAPSRSYPCGRLFSSPLQTRKFSQKPLRSTAVALSAPSHRAAAAALSRAAARRPAVRPPLMRERREPADRRSGAEARRTAALPLVPGRAPRRLHPERSSAAVRNSAAHRAPPTTPVHPRSAARSRPSFLSARRPQQRRAAYCYWNSPSAGEEKERSVPQQSQPGERQSC
mmetsp:Transcript_22536/g.56984  ORF Transcript_22536/g.56984 Transcript_22536/m.56984 type:complete len:204 (-) Transcript_22536:888-1499(-)